MALVDFEYNQICTTIQCNPNEMMKDIYQKLALKTNIDINTVYFYYNGREINSQLTFEQIISSNDRESNRIRILVCSTEEINNKQNISLIKSNNIICPECGEFALLEIKDYKINIYGCINDHTINNILFEKFENLQKIDISKIVCDNCNKNKSDSYNYQFYTCTTCNNNLCPICFSKHNKKHKIFVNPNIKNMILLV